MRELRVVPRKVMPFVPSQGEEGHFLWRKGEKIVFGLLDAVFPVMFLLLFVLFIALFVWMIVSGLQQWHKNNNSPRLTVDAEVVTKRTSVHGGGEHSHASTSHYVTFQMDSGDRMELPVTGSEYGMLVEGDRGRLTFQGTRYLGFERRR